MRRIAKVLLVGLLLLAMSIPSAFAELRNVDLQNAGGLAAVNGSDTFFFSPIDLEKKSWGLYSIKTFANGPLSTITDVKPARFVYADSKKIFFLALYNGDSLYMLVSVPVGGGEPKKELDNIAGVFVESESTFLYVPADDLYTISRFNMENSSAKKLKTMTSKTIYDASVGSDDTVYFLGKDEKKLYGYEINKKSGKAINLSNPSPAMGLGMMYGDYLVYSQNGDTTRVYAQQLGKSKSQRLGERIGAMSLSNPRFGSALFPYDEASKAIIRVPLDGSEHTSLPVESEKLASYIIGGSAEKIYYWDNDKVFSTTGTLSGKTELFPFLLSTDGVKWTDIAPTNQNFVLMMGFTPITYGDYGKSLPTAVHLINLETKETVFKFPVIETGSVEEGAADTTETAQPSAQIVDEPQAVIVVEEKKENEDVSFSDFFKTGN